MERRNGGKEDGGKRRCGELIWWRKWKMKERKSGGNERREKI